MSETYTQTWSAHILPSPMNAKVIDGSRRASGKNEAAGVLSCGPYAYIKPGRYRISINYSGFCDGTESLGAFDVGFFSGDTPITITAGGIGESGINKQVICTIEIPDVRNNLEVRVFFSGRGDLSLHSISIESLVIYNLKQDVYFESLGSIPTTERITLINDFADYDAFIESYRSQRFNDLTEKEFLSSHLLNFKHFVHLFGRMPPYVAPFSPAYREWEMAFFHFLSGKIYRYENEGPTPDVAVGKTSPPPSLIKILVSR